MKREKMIGLLIALALLMMVSCANDDEFVENGKPVNVEMAYAFSTSAKAGKMTRQVAQVVQGNEQGTVRLPSSMIILQLENVKPQQLDYRFEELVSKTDPRARFYRTSYCNLVEGVNGCIVYGDVDDLPAPSGTSTKVYNGSLEKHFPDAIVTEKDYEDDIKFNLESIYDAETSGVPAGATALANALNAITEAGDWKTTNDEAGFLQGLLLKFTNNGYSLPGSAANVRKWIELLIHEITPHLTEEDPKYIADETVRSILERIKSTAEEQLLTAIADYDYPRDINLPDGAAVVRWADVTVGNETVKKFVPQINTTTLDNINSIERFAYPASLYYFVRSDLRASNESVDFDDLYTNSPTWTDVVNDARFKTYGSNVVTGSSRAVILTKPVQYAVAQLQINMKAYTSTLKDAKGNNVTVGDTSFPLKGIIVCDQHPVDYKFEPAQVQDGSFTEADVRFIYDSQVPNNCYLKTTANADTWIAASNTLVLQSLDGEDVNVILEFENNSGSDFECLDGVVYRGTRFYLIGEVDYDRYNVGSTVNDDNRNRVFTKDYITTVNMTVTSLEKAYNVPPNLLTNNLEIGVETTPDWVGSTPTVIRLE